MFNEIFLSPWPQRNRLFLRFSFFFIRAWDMNLIAGYDA